jgi:hypothetical protein
MASCALGFRVHSGWAALVALAAGSREDPSPRVAARFRIEIADPSIDGSKQPYHAAEPMPLAQAARYLARCERKLGTTPAAVESRVAGWRAELGPPWTADQKLAAAAAWIALVSAGA